MKKKPDPVIRDHVRKGKRLVPPFLNALGDRYAPYSWERQIVPEFIWLALLIREHGLQSAVELATRLGKASAQVCARDPKPLFAKLSSFAELDESEKEKLLDCLEEESVAKLQTALASLNALTNTHPLHFFFGDSRAAQKSPKDLEDIVNSMADRESPDAVLSIATAVYMGMTQGKILHGPDLHEKRMRDFADIAHYPHTEASRKAAGAFRASAPMFLFAGRPEDIDETWISFFWQRVAGFGSCTSSVGEFRADLKRETPMSDDFLEQLLTNYRNSAKDELKYRLDRWALDLNELKEV